MRGVVERYADRERDDHYGRGFACTCCEDMGRVLEALREIAKGEGAFSRDPLTHASNTIDSMKAIAEAALGERHINLT